MESPSFGCEYTERYVDITGQTCVERRANTWHQSLTDDFHAALSALPAPLWTDLSGPVWRCKVSGSCAWRVFRGSSIWVIIEERRMEECLCVWESSLLLASVFSLKRGFFRNVSSLESNAWIPVSSHIYWFCLLHGITCRAKVCFDDQTSYLYIILFGKERMVNSPEQSWFLYSVFL